MKKLISISLLFLFILVMAAGSTFAQSRYGVIGKKFGKREANALFGKVVKSQTVTRTEMKNALARAKDYVMFRMNDKNNSLNKYGSSNILTESSSLAAGEKVYLFSKTVVEDFVSSSTSNEFVIESRAGVLTVSDGFNILEMAAVCPPICPE